MGQENLFVSCFSFCCWRLRRPRLLNSTQLKRRERDRKPFELPLPLTSVPDYREPRLISLKEKKTRGEPLRVLAQGAKIKKREALYHKRARKP